MKNINLKILAIILTLAVSTSISYASKSMNATAKQQSENKVEQTVVCKENISNQPNDCIDAKSNNDVETLLSTQQALQSKIDALLVERNMLQKKIEQLIQSENEHKKFLKNLANSIDKQTGMQLDQNTHEKNEEVDLKMLKEDLRSLKEALDINTRYLYCRGLPGCY